MGFKKYLNDYRLENVENKKGKIVTKAVYRGDYFVYRYRGEELRRARITVISCSACLLVAFVLGLVFYRNSGFTSQYYTLAPYLLCLFPIFYLCLAVYNVIKTGEGVKTDREHKDGIHDRIAKCTTGIMILDGLCFAGLIVSTVLKITGVETRPFLYTDAVFIAASSLVLMLSAAVFVSKKKLVMEKM